MLDASTASTCNNCYTIFSCTFSLNFHSVPLVLFIPKYRLTVLVPSLGTDLFASKHRVKLPKMAAWNRLGMDKIVSFSFFRWKFVYLQYTEPFSTINASNSLSHFSSLSAKIPFSQDSKFHQVHNVRGHPVLISKIPKMTVSPLHMLMYDLVCELYKYYTYI